jgi:shikimate kinase
VTYGTAAIPPLEIGTTTVFDAVAMMLGGLVLTINKEVEQCNTSKMHTV